jgi:3-hydroxybutyryl-CoA dehydrogenase
LAAPLPRDAIVAVIGAGAMGAGIAQVAAQAGHLVRLHDTRDGAAAAARERIAGTLRSLAAKGRTSEEAAAQAAQRIVPIAALGEVEGSALVIEAVVEDLAVKRALFAAVERCAGDDAILATNTSSLSITALAAGLRRPPRVARQQYYTTAPLKPQEEVVSGLATDAGVAATLHATAAAWGKTPVHAASTPGFIVNRVARPFYAEALRLLAERAGDCATLDAVLREAGGFRMGPFELMDLIGHDVNFAVTCSVWEAFFHDPRFLPSRLQQELVDAGFLGRKSGRGFYEYASGADKPLPVAAPAARAPEAVTLQGEPGLLAPLVARWHEHGMRIDVAPAVDAFPDGALRAGEVTLALTDGRTATSRAVVTATPDLALLDLAFDYADCPRLAFAVADTAQPLTADVVAGALQAAGIAPSRLDDVAGLAVMRTVAMLANEAADAVTQGVATPADLDLAMRKGVNYPRGPLEWADELGVARVRGVLANLAAHYGEDRYRLAPLIARRALAGAPLSSSPSTTAAT